MSRIEEVKDRDVMERAIVEVLSIQVRSMDEVTRDHICDNLDSIRRAYY